MAAPTNAFTTIDAKGNREDLENVIYRVSPEATPFTSNIARVKAKAVKHEWQTEDLSAPSANGVLEGDDATIDAANNTSRVSNTAQIFRRTFAVSGTQEEVDSAGRASDIARLKVLKGIEMKRDIELRLIGNNGEKVDQSGGTPRLAAGALAFLTSNTSLGAGGANGGFAGGVTTAATNGTTRTFTETLLKNAMAAAWDKGAAPSQCYVGSVHKMAASGFTGIAQNRNEMSRKGSNAVIGAADVYVSDFGEITFIPVQYGLTRDALLIDPDKWAVATLRDMEQIDLAKTGDSYKYAVICEKTLVCRNEKANVAIRDLA